MTSATKNRIGGLILLAAIASVSYAAGAAQGRPVNTAPSREDLAAIEKLRSQDITATLSQDLTALSNLWTDDIVRLQQGAEAEVGKPALLASEKRRRETLPDFRVVSYVPDMKELTVTSDGWAFEWGYFTGTYVATPGGDETRIRGKLLRILRKQADGSWKGARGMWNTSE